MASDSSHLTSHPATRQVPGRAHANCTSLSLLAGGCESASYWGQVIVHEYLEQPIAPRIPLPPEATDLLKHSQWKHFLKYTSNSLEYHIGLGVLLGLSCGFQRVSRSSHFIHLFFSELNVICLNFLSIPLPFPSPDYDFTSTS